MGREELEALGNAFTLMHAQGYTDPKTGKKLLPLILLSPPLSRCFCSPERGAWKYSRSNGNISSCTKDWRTYLTPRPGLRCCISLLQPWPCWNRCPASTNIAFPGRRGAGHIVNVKDTWRRLLETAGLSGWRIHDLRHAYASYAASSGKSLPVIGAILGHSQPATTQRYAHLADNPVAVAAAETAAQIQKDFTGGKVLPFKKAAG